jgi:hypothetical protein
VKPKEDASQNSKEKQGEAQQLQEEFPFPWEKAGKIGRTVVGILATITAIRALIGEEESEKTAPFKVIRAAEALRLGHNVVGVPQEFWQQKNFKEHMLLLDKIDIA